MGRTKPEIARFPAPKGYLRPARFTVIGRRVFSQVFVGSIRHGERYAFLVGKYLPTAHASTWYPLRRVHPIEGTWAIAVVMVILCPRVC